MVFGSNRGNGVIGAAATAMNAVGSRREDSEDLFAHTRMSMGDHIEEMRRHMIKALIGFFLALIAGFIVTRYVLISIKTRAENAFCEMNHKRVQPSVTEPDAFPYRYTDSLKI